MIHTTVISRYIKEIPEGLVYQRVNSNRFNTTIRIAGMTTSVDMEVEGLMRRWPPQGYGTRIVFEREEGDRKLVDVTYSHSCD